MIYIVCALYAEAAPYIQHFSLKKQTAFHRVQVFANEQVTCVLTGVGPMAAATALTEVLAQSAIGPNDVLVNVGICGCKDGKVPVGTTYLCHTIQDGITDRTYYPDVLYKHPFLEADLYSSAVPLTKEAIQQQPCLLVDMEGAAVYQSAIRFFKTHQLFFVKTVSDYGCEADPVMGSVEQVLSWLPCTEEAALFTTEQEAELVKLCDLLKASVTMELEIRQLMTWCQLTGRDGVALFYTFLQQQEVDDVKSKREGAALLAKFKQQLL